MMEISSTFHLYYAMNAFDLCLMTDLKVDKSHEKILIDII